MTVLSRDKDLAAILRGEEDELADLISGRRRSRAQWQQDSGLRCEQLADYLALAGDSSDGIPGVPGVGGKTASILLNKYKGVDEIFDNLHNIKSLPLRGAAGLAQRLCSHRQALLLYRQLTRLREDIPLPEGAALAARRPPDRDIFAALQAEGVSARRCQRWRQDFPALFESCR